MKIKLYISFLICFIIIGCGNKDEVVIQDEVETIIPETNIEKFYHSHDNEFYPLKQTMEDLQYQVNNLKARVEEYELTLHAPTLNSELLKLIKAPQVEHEFILDNGTIIQGKIINETADQVLVQTRIGQLKLDKAYIMSIENIDPLVPHLTFSKQNIKEKKGKNSLVVSGKIINEGGRRADFVRIIYKLWETDTKFLFSDSVFVSGNSVVYSNGIISDACLEPGAIGSFSMSMDFNDSIKVSYWTKDIKFDFVE